MSIGADKLHTVHSIVGSDLQCLSSVTATYTIIFCVYDVQAGAPFLFQ